MPLFRCIYFYIYFFLGSLSIFFQYWFFVFFGRWGLGLMPLFRRIYFLGGGGGGLYASF